MRNALVVTLALSLAANVFFLTRPANSALPDPSPPPEQPAQAEKPQPHTDQPRIDISSLSPEVVAALREVDPATLRDLLEACGASGPMVRAAVAGAIRQQHMAEHHAIIVAHGQPGWWQPQPSLIDLPSLRRLERKIADEEARVVGQHPQAREPGFDELYAFLPEAKKSALQRIGDDYDRMRLDLPQFLPRLFLDETRSELLDEEYRKDVAELLSSDELAEFDFRKRALLAGMELRHLPLTDEEFRKALAIIQTRDSELEAGGYVGRSVDPFAPFNPDDPAEKIKEAARKQLDTLVGPEKLLIAARNKNHLFQEMVNFADLLEIPKADIEKVFDQSMEREADHDPSTYRLNHRKLRETLVRTLPPDVYRDILESVSMTSSVLKTENAE